MVRKVITNKLDSELYKQIQILAIALGRNANDLMEEGMRSVLKRYLKEGGIQVNLKDEDSKH